MNKIEEIQKLKNEMNKDQDLPLRSTATNLVLGEGNPESNIFFLGEAPGYWEDQKGRPFVGNAGTLLNKLLVEAGLKRPDVFISNVVCFRPPDNRDPMPEEIASFAPYIDRLIEIVNPWIIVTLGRFSMAKFLPNVKISLVHGKKFELKWRGKDLWIVPMFHPAAALRRIEIMNEIKKDFQKLSNYLAEHDKLKRKQMELI